MARPKPKPKPHDWRESVREVAVVVVGIIIALTGEQLIESNHWRQKVKTAEIAMRAEFADSLANALEHRLLNPCTKRYLDTLEAAVVRKDAATIRKLYDMGPPFVGRTWVNGTWTAALNSQISDHIATERLTVYSKAFQRVSTLRDFQAKTSEEFGPALTGRFGVAQDPAAMDHQLAAIGRLRRYEAARLDIGNALLTGDGPALSVKTSAAAIARARTSAAKCEAGMKSLI